MKRIGTAHTAKQATTARRLRIAAAAAITLAAGAAAARASELSVNFETGISTTFVLSGSTAVGVPGVAELPSSWNQVTGSGGTTGVTDSSSQTASLTFSGLGNWNTYSGQETGDENLQLLNAYVYSYTNVSAVTATVSSLPSEYTTKGYSVYVYFDNSGAGEQGSVTVSGSGNTYGFYAEGSGFAPGGSSDFVQTSSSTPVYADYAVFSGLSSSSFTISLNTITTPGAAGIAGFQVVAAPEPCSAAVLGLGATTLLLRRRRSFVETQVKSPEYANDFDYRCASIDRRASRVLSP